MPINPPDLLSIIDTALSMATGARATIHVTRLEQIRSEIERLGFENEALKGKIQFYADLADHGDRG